MKQSIHVAIILAAFVLVTFSKATSAQLRPANADQIAKQSDMYCTGFISEFSPRPDLQVVGGEKENDKSSFSQGDIVYLNKGREGGVQSGASYYIIRPLGPVKNPFTKKKAGYFVRELGMLRVVETHEKTAVAEITVSCDSVELGDLLRPYEANAGPQAQEGHPLARFSEGSGGLTGRIILSPGYREYLSANQVVFIDLGNRQGVRPGDHFSIYRKITRGEFVVKVPTDDILQERSGGFGSTRYHGGEYSNSATRVTRAEVLKNRPALPRKVMGELVVLKVENTAAVALIVNSVGEVNIGDFIERVN